jgi:hypothetical protein
MVCPTGPSREGSARPSPLIFNLLRSRVFELHRGNCRGGPPWPPFVKSEKLAATKGGHGGPPLQLHRPWHNTLVARICTTARQ